MIGGFFKGTRQIAGVSLKGTGVKKREVRAVARFLTISALAFLAINVITFHQFKIMPLAATGLYALAAVANFITALADEGSFHSGAAFCGDFLMMIGAALVWLMQIGAGETSSEALSKGLHFISFLFEVILIVVNWFGTVMSASVEKDHKK
mmetsp:Transcript_83260/g.156690  ORF Transcript_83260/g.156690 Transcript_83260/m.156690 type:complete len:151 (+) Transcript_83260:70-522(+)